NGVVKRRTIRKKRRARQNAVAMCGDNPAIDAVGETEVVRIYDQPFHRLRWGTAAVRCFECKLLVTLTKWLTVRMRSAIFCHILRFLIVEICHFCGLKNNVAYPPRNAASCTSLISKRFDRCVRRITGLALLWRLPC